MGRLNDKVAMASEWAASGICGRAAAELGRANIRVNTLFPDMIRAPMLDSNSAEVLAHFGAMIRLDRIGRPEELAQFVAFLASDTSSYVNGTRTLIDGGLLL
jgi:3alpha(or 20beta)-hydroxysteroid dehydrogenase